MTATVSRRRHHTNNRAHDHRGGPHLQPVPHHTDNGDAGGGRQLPHNIDAERATLGACLQSNPDTITAVRALICDDDWYQPRHALIWATIAQLHNAGEPADPITVAQAITDPAWRRPDDDLYLHQLYTDTPTNAGTATHHARIIATTATARRVQEHGIRLVQAAQRADLDNLDDLLARAEDQITSARTLLDASGATTRPRSLDVDTFLAVDDVDEQYDWLVPGLLERSDRVILTGPEGGGKSTLGRQVATMVAAGLHPFTGDHTAAPGRVLILDLENSERQLRRALRPLRVRAGDHLAGDQLRIEVRLDGIDLHTHDDRVWLDQLIADAAPDLVVTGPIYKMGTGDPTTEEFAKPISAALDHLRARHGCALWIEAHSPKMPSGSRRRPIEPYGASLWLRWPEFGVHISREGEIEHWRGQRDASREWPTALTRGGTWPWSPITDITEMRWQKILAARRESGQQMTYSDIEKATGIARATITRIIGAGARYGHEWARINATLEADNRGDVA